jgi:hypothetical protein
VAVAVNGYAVVGRRRAPNRVVLDARPGH